MTLKKLETLMGKIVLYGFFYVCVKFCGNFLCIFQICTMMHEIWIGTENYQTMIVFCVRCSMHSLSIYNNNNNNILMLFTIQIELIYNNNNNTIY